MLQARLLLVAIPSLLLAYGCAPDATGARVSKSTDSAAADDDEGDEGAGTNDSDAADATPPGFEITGAALFQGVKLPLFGEGATEGDAIPVVVERPGVVRFYKHVLDASLDQETRVTFRYRDVDGAVQELTASATIDTDSDDTDASSVIDVAVPAAAFHAALEYQVEVRDGLDHVVSNYPEDGESFAPLPADERTKAVHVVIVPVQYGAGSSSLLPDTSAAQLKRLSEQMRALYPVSEVDVTVRSRPLEWDQEISADGTGWDDLLYGILQERQRDGVSEDTYYYGAFNPASSFQRFCQQGCVAGLSLLSETVQDASARGSIGLGFSGDEAAETFAHEIGHAHGRAHSPCGGAAQPDPDYPYSRASIGVPGWDVRDSQFVQVGSGSRGATDFMGYCENTWVSDYTWKALFTRITRLEARVSTVASLLPVDYRVLRVNAASASPARWLGQLTVRGNVSDVSVHAALADGTGIELAQLDLDHLPGHVLYVPASLSGQTLRIAGVSGPVTVP